MSAPTAPFIFGSNPSATKSFFLAKELKGLMSSEAANNTAALSCNTILRFGFFFDGTRNNYAESSRAGNRTHTNVARLFDAHPGRMLVPAGFPEHEGRFPPSPADFTPYFRVYVPGVGTPFDELGDSGRGIDGALGAATGLWGAERIVWALFQAINAVHLYFHGALLVSPARVRQAQLRALVDRHALDALASAWAPSFTRGVLMQALADLHRSIRLYMAAPGARPAKVDPGIVRGIHLNVFGYSRGAAAARAFANWFVQLCTLDARMLGRTGLTLGGFPVSFDFLGLFDTVASVGLAASTGHFHGHFAWADNERSLRVPAQVRRCVPFVAGHEVRRAFPVDSIAVDGALDPRHDELVFPGVHADIGGGCEPGEQGRGLDPDGADLLSRIPLALMYREARLAGAPLKLEVASPLARQRFLVDPGLIEAFNGYVGPFQPEAGRIAPRRPLSVVLREQMRQAILWRRHACPRMAQMPSVQRARRRPLDASDLLSANTEFAQEMQQFERYRREPTLTLQTGLAAEPAWVERPNVPAADSQRADEWAAIARFWDAPPPGPAVARLFEDYVHDSRAWFRLVLRPGEAEELIAIVDELTTQYKRRMGAKHPHRPLDEEPDAALRQRMRLGDGLERLVDARSDVHRMIRQYLATGARPLVTTRGREGLSYGAGYLRFRRFYQGSDHAFADATELDPPIASRARAAA